MKQIRTPLIGTPLGVLPQTSSSGPQHPADELAELRRARMQIEAREQALLDHFRNLGRPNQIKASDIEGSSHRIKVIEHRKKVLDVTRLPQIVVANADYYRPQRVTHIATHPLVPDQKKMLN